MPFSTQLKRERMCRLNCSTHGLYVTAIIGITSGHKQSIRKYWRMRTLATTLEICLKNRTPRSCRQYRMMTTSRCSGELTCLVSLKGKSWYLSISPITKSTYGLFMISTKAGSQITLTLFSVYFTRLPFSIDLTLIPLNFCLENVRSVE
jgi:hypothetical protein